MSNAHQTPVPLVGEGTSFGPRQPEERRELKRSADGSPLPSAKRLLTQDGTFAQTGKQLATNKPMGKAPQTPIQSVGEGTKTSCAPGDKQRGLMGAADGSPSTLAKPQSTQGTVLEQPRDSSQREDDGISDERIRAVEKEHSVRLDKLESRMDAQEETMKKTCKKASKLLPKVDALLSGRSSAHPSESTRTSSDDSTSVLELAEQGADEALLQLLAVKQIDVRNNPPRTVNGDTALHVAANGGHLKALIALLGAGAKVDAVGNRLRTPLHCAVVQGHLAVARHLLYVGADVNAKDVDGSTPLDFVAQQGSKDLVNLLLKNGASLLQKVVFTAVENGHWNLVELFVEKKIDVDACNKEGHPLIVLAAKSDRWEIVDLLMEKRACVTKCNDPKESALVYASKSGLADVVRELLRRGASSVSEQVAVAIGVARSAAVVWAFKEMTPGKMSDNVGNMGLVLSGRDGRYNSLVAFLEAGVGINATSFKGHTSLHLAAWNGKIRCVKELLQRGADPNASNEEGNTPLHMASSKGHVDCVRALLDSGANISAENNEEKTPLDVARSDAVRAVFNRTANSNLYLRTSIFI